MGRALNTEQIRKLVRTIDHSKGDPEAAHVAEDRLYIKTLKAIAAGAEEPEKLAEEALKAVQIDFDRWYS